MIPFLEPLKRNFDIRTPGVYFMKNEVAATDGMRMHVAPYWGPKRGWYAWDYKTPLDIIRELDREFSIMAPVNVLKKKGRARKITIARAQERPNGTLEVTYLMSEGKPAGRFRFQVNPEFWEEAQRMKPPRLIYVIDYERPMHPIVISNGRERAIVMPMRRDEHCARLSRQGTPQPKGRNR